MNTSKETPFEQINWPALMLSLKNKKLIPFLGSGASLGLSGSQGLPSSSELAEMLANECGYPGDDSTDLLRVAQYYAIHLGETTLRDSVENKLGEPEVQPSEVHRILANWPIEIVLTTNYDRLMERAFSEAGKDPFHDIYDRRGNQRQIESEPFSYKPLVYKLHGSLYKKDSMVLTEDDAIDFLISLINGNPKVPDRIRALFRTCCILFIGYGLKDWNIRVLLRYFRENEVDIRSFAIQKFEPRSAKSKMTQEWDNMVLYWEHKKISVYNCDALSFLRELDRRYKQEKAV